MAAELCGLSALNQTTVGWAARAMRFKENPGTPLHPLLTIAKHADELTPGSQQIANNAVRALLAPMPLASFMDEADAKFSLEQVEAKVVTRAARRAAEAAAVSAAEEARKMALGAARAAKRAAIATRPPSTSIIVDNALRVHRM